MKTFDGKPVFTVVGLTVDCESIGEFAFASLREAHACAKTFMFWKMYRSNTKFPIADCLPEIT